MLSRLSFTAARCMPSSSSSIRVVAYGSAGATRVAAPAALTCMGATRHFSLGGSSEKKPVRVAVTGAAGNIGYALIFRIASGEMLGKDQPVILQLLELPDALTKLKGTVMELEDCAFPLLRGVVQSSDENKAFEGADYAMLVGARPRSKGMERNDLLVANGEIFTKQGKALNSVANRDTIRVCVVGNPANTNCLIAARNAPNILSLASSDIDPKRFTAMTRLDHNRATHQIAQQTGSIYNDIKKLAIWGNHSSTMYPDVTNATIKGKAAKQVINNDGWLKDPFLPVVQQRGAAIMAARGLSSAASAASSAIDHVHDWVLGTNKDDWTSMAVHSDGSYGVEKGLYFSFPVTCEGGQYKIVQGLKFDQYGQEKMDKTQQELKDEKKAIEHLLK